MDYINPKLKKHHIKKKSVFKSAINRKVSIRIHLKTLVILLILIFVKLRNATL